MPEIDSRGADHAADPLELGVGAAHGVTQLDHDGQRLHAQDLDRRPDLLQRLGDRHQDEGQQDHGHHARDGDDQCGQLGGGHRSVTGRLRSMRVRISCSKPWDDGS